MKKRFTVQVLQTRAGNVAAIMEIDATSEKAAAALRDDIYDTINRMRNLLGPLQYITTSEELNEPERGDSLMVYVPDATRGDLIAALATMPDEAFGWFVLACAMSAMTKGGNAQIWPDGMGGFSSESRASVDVVRAAADTYMSQK